MMDTIEFNVDFIPKGLHLPTLEWVEKLLESRCTTLQNNSSLDATHGGIALAEKLVREVRMVSTRSQGK